jgi:signal transduction histidine kinase
VHKVVHIQRLLLRFERLPLWIIGMALAVLAATIWLARQQLRDQIRAQIAGRDGEVLYAVARMHMEALADDYDDAADADAFASIQDPDNQLTVLLRTSRLKSVLAARLFDQEGRCFEVFPEGVRQAELSAEQLRQLHTFKPTTRFHSPAHWADLFESSQSPSQQTNALAVLEVNVPLHDDRPELAGIAQFLIEGHSLAEEFATLDRHLTHQALAAFGVSGAVLVALVGWALRRLRRTGRLLEERTANLVQANQELARAARTSAVGAVTAHLIHGLKSPLSGLHNLVASVGQNDAAPGETDWQTAVASTRRMQALVNQVVSVLREETGAAHYEVTLAELGETVAARVRPQAQARGVEIRVEQTGQAAFSNRTANLVILIVTNLVQNAVEATPPGKSVRLVLTVDSTGAQCRVCDEGPGLPPGVHDPLFTPCRSTKEGGSGLGLAISKHLANYLEADLALVCTSAQGTTFALKLPQRLLQPSAWAGAPAGHPAACETRT